MPGLRGGFDGGEMTALYKRTHGTKHMINWDRLPVIQLEHLPQVYEVSFPRDTTKCQCPFPECPGLSLQPTALEGQYTDPGGSPTAI